MWFKKKSPKVAVKLGILCKPEYVYFVDNIGDVSCQKLDRSSPPEFVVFVGIMKRPEYNYFVNRSTGDVVVKKIDEQISEEERLQLQFASEDNAKQRKEIEEKEEEIGEKETREAEDKELLGKFKEEEKEKLRLERLRKRARQEVLEEEYKYIPEDEKVRHIPDEVKEFVWRRDQGKCVKCGSQENIEFDHIIPLSKGGSNTARNIQLLCERCNREKSNKI